MWRLAPVMAFILALSPQTPAPADEALREALGLARAGQYEAAARLYADLLDRLPNPTLERGRALDGLGAVENALGRYAAAATHGHEAASLYAGLGEPRRQGAALNRAGLAHLYLGDYQPAATAFEQAIALSVSEGDAAAHAEQVTNLGNVRFFLGRYGEAAVAYSQALVLADTNAESDWAARRRRLTLVNQATLDQRLGRDREALERYRQVQAEGETLRPAERAQVMANLGVLYRRLGDPVKALATYDDALTLFERDRNVDGEIGVINNRGIALALDLGDLAGARTAFTEGYRRASAAGNQREMLHAQLYRGETHRLLGDLESARADFDASLRLARDLQTPEEEWKALYGLGRIDETQNDEPNAQRHFEEAVGVIESLREEIRVPAHRSDFFSDKRVVYDGLIAIHLRHGLARELFGLLERSRSRAWRDRLGLSMLVDVDAVQRVLDEGTLLLDYWHAPAGAAVVAVTRTTIDLRPVDAPDALVTELIERLSRGPSLEWSAAAAALAARVLPVDLLTGITHVIVVGDGGLNLVPFDVLSVDGQPLVTHAAVSYVPTAAVLLREPGASGLLAPWQATINAFADPAPGSPAPGDAGPPGERLEHTLEEVDMIADELGGVSSVHTGANNLKATLLATADTAPVLHLATHAVADGDALEQSRILFSPASAGGPSDYLYLREAYELPLAGVELAVLSACDTARGRLVRGEGVQSFSRAFLAAGARSTVTTLWRVDDGATAELMRVFYYHLRRGVPRAEALRQAKLSFIDSGSPLAKPHYWAAFVLTGDGARPIPRVVGWRVPVVMLVGVLAVTGLIARRRHRAGALVRSAPTS